MQMKMKKYLLFIVAAMLATVARAADYDMFKYQGFSFMVISEADHEVELLGYEGNLSGDITIPSSAINGTSRYFVVGVGDCSGDEITSLTIPSTVRYIYGGAFEDSKNLKSVNIPDGIPAIEGNTFRGCSSLTSLDIPASVTKIGDNAFWGCSSLQSLNIPAGVTKIGENAFWECSSLTSVNTPDGVTEIGEYTFAGCKSLQSITIPGSVTKIGDYAFQECSGLTSVTIPEGVTEIGTKAFGSCSALTSVTIPGTVTSIGRSAFGVANSLGASEGCSALAEINVEEGNKHFSSEDGVLYNLDKTVLLACPGAKTEYTFPASVTEIGESAFSGCSNLTSVTIPEGVAEIGGGAFSCCSSLTSIFIPTSVTKIGTTAFWKCTSLTSAIIPDKVTSISERLFMYCSNLTSVTIPASVTKIDEWAFYDCERLKAIYNLNPTPQSVGEDAFKYVPKDAVVYVPKGSYKDYFVNSGWIYFSDFCEMGVLDIALSETALRLDIGATATVTATVTKDEDMTVESEEWTSSNPEVATVDNGVITAVAPGLAVICFTAVDANGMHHIKSCNVTVIDPSGVDAVITDADAPVEVFNLQGVAVLRGAASSELGNLPAGLYIVRQGKVARKVLVK